jgi:hypothetical protein
MEEKIMDVIREAICSQIENIPCSDLTAYTGRKGEKSTCLVGYNYDGDVQSAIQTVLGVFEDASYEAVAAFVVNGRVIVFRVSLEDNLQSYRFIAGGVGMNARIVRDGNVLVEMDCLGRRAFSKKISVRDAIAMIDRFVNTFVSLDGSESDGVVRNRIVAAVSVVS